MRTPPLGVSVKFIYPTFSVSVKNGLTPPPGAEAFQGSSTGHMSLAFYKEIFFQFIFSTITSQF